MTDTQNCPLCFNSTTTDSAVEEYNRQVRRDENKHLLAQIEALNELLEPALIELENVKECASQWELRNEELVRELAAAKRDGERYRWLRQRMYVKEIHSDAFWRNLMCPMDMRDLNDDEQFTIDVDKAIDAAIEQGGRGNG